MQKMRRKGKGKAAKRCLCSRECPANWSCRETITSLHAKLSELRKNAEEKNKEEKVTSTSFVGDLTRAKPPLHFGKQ